MSCSLIMNNTFVPFPIFIVNILNSCETEEFSMRILVSATQDSWTAWVKLLVKLILRGTDIVSEHEIDVFKVYNFFLFEDSENNQVGLNNIELRPILPTVVYYANNNGCCGKSFSNFDC